MTSRNFVKIFTISLFLLVSLFSTIFVTAYTSNPIVYAKELNNQSNGNPWNLTITYSVKNNVFMVNTSLIFLHNVTLLYYSSPAFNYWIYNSSFHQIFALNPPSISYTNKSFTANQLIISSVSVPLTKSIIPSTDNYSISLNYIPVNKVLDNTFSAVVSNTSINVTFKNSQITTSGSYVYPTSTSISSTTSNSSTKSNNNSLSLNWLWLVFIPIVFMSFKRRKILP